MATNTCTYEGCTREVNYPHDNEYCVFHAPVEKKGVTGERFNQLIKQQIKQGDFHFTGYIFPVFVDFSQYRKEFAQAKEVNFSNAQFYGTKRIMRTLKFFKKKPPYATDATGGDVENFEIDLDLCCDFSYIEFSGFVSFQKTVFHNDVLFYKTQWKNNKLFQFTMTMKNDEKQIKDSRKLKIFLNIVDTKFKNKVIFYRCIFKTNVSLIGAQFSGDTFFEYIQFSGDTSFKKTKFSRITSFDNVHFSKNTSFEEAQFLGDTYFDNIQFAGNISFKNIIFKEDVYFKNVHLLGHISFDNAHFSKKTSFEEAQFSGDDILFKKTKFSGDTSFKNAQFSGYNISFEEAQFSGDNTSFDNAHFSKKTSFEEAQFSGDSTSFDNAHFSGETSFEEVKFLGDSTSFDNAHFSGYKTSFKNAQFSAKKIYFDNAHFSGETSFEEVKFLGDSTSFDNAHFSGYKTSFKNAQFSAKKISFDNAHFSKNTSFEKAQFSGDTSFENAKLLGKTYFENARLLKEISFENAQLLGITSFLYCYIKYRFIFRDIGLSSYSQIIFENLQFDNTASFYLQGISISKKNDKKANVSYHIIRFSNIQFPPFQVYFEDVRKPKHLQSNMPVILFRYCNLKDVYFSNNDMGLFSFYKSAFDEARFISVNWGSWKKRQNVLGDEILLREIIRLQNQDQANSQVNDDTQDNKQLALLKERFQVFDDIHYLEIASLYRRMKTALDRAKDYPEASKFYYNEFEMRREYLRQNKRQFPVRWSLYSLYHALVGYGERAGRSFLWFCVFIALFAGLYLMNGYVNFQGEYVNYDFGLQYLTWSNFKIALVDYGKAIVHALLLILPRNFLFVKMSNSHIPFHQVVIQLFNVLAAYFFLTFTIIGLKRHFRRY